MLINIKYKYKFKNEKFKVLIAIINKFELRLNSNLKWIQNKN